MLPPQIYSPSLKNVACHGQDRSVNTNMLCTMLPPQIYSPSLKNVACHGQDPGPVRGAGVEEGKFLYMGLVPQLSSSHTTLTWKQERSSPRCCTLWLSGDWCGGIKS